MKLFGISARGAALLGAAILAAPAALALAQGGAGAMPAVVAPGVDGPVQVLAAAIRKELEPLPCTATPEDVEAAIVFALSQSDPAGPELIRNALREVELMRTCYAGQSKAIGRVRTALLSYGVRQGTAALGGDSYLGTGSLFSTPNLTVGGGSVNYSN